MKKLISIFIFILNPILIYSLIKFITVNVPHFMVVIFSSKYSVVDS
jgi:hypothetical protein